MAIFLRWFGRTAPKPAKVYFGASLELSELKRDLLQEDTRLEALRKIVAAMMQGRDISSLFSNVMSCLQFNEIEQKKLVYLYLMNYARRLQDLAMLSVNSFVRDAKEHEEPLVRGLAIRTLGSIRVPKMVPYLVDVTRAALTDSDPYVRKSATLSVVKLVDMARDAVLESDLIPKLQATLQDPNSLVVTNALAALQEVCFMLGDDELLPLNAAVVQQLLVAMREASDWGMVTLMDVLSQYEPGSMEEAQTIFSRVGAQLRHRNPAVILACVKVLVAMVESAADADEDFARQILESLRSPLVSLLNHRPQIQYVALRNLRLVAHKFPDLLVQDYAIFFCKYNDPIYVKLEKLEILLLLANGGNVTEILLELKQYCLEEVDSEFVRGVIRAIGRCALSIEAAAAPCVRLLLELVKTKQRESYIGQEAIIMARDLFRRYPGRFELVIGKLFPLVKALDLPEAKAAFIWIIGQYSDKIDNAMQLLAQFAGESRWFDEEPLVQLQLVTSLVKLHLRLSTGGGKRAGEARELLVGLLGEILESSDDPDLLDRAGMYQRLLSGGGDLAQRVMMAKLPTVVDDGRIMDPALNNQLLEELGLLSSVFHRPSTLFVGEDLDEESEESGVYEDDVAPDPDFETGEGGAGVPDTAPGAAGMDDVDLLGLGDPLPMDTGPGPGTGPGAGAGAGVGLGADLLGPDPLLVLGGGGGGGSTLPVSSAPAAPSQPPASAWPNLAHVVPYSAETPIGVHAGLGVHDRNVWLFLRLDNGTEEPLTQLDVALNQNLFGLAPVNGTGVALPSPAAPRTSGQVAIPLRLDPQHQNPNAPPVAIEFLLRIGTRSVRQAVPLTVEAVLVEPEGESEATIGPSWQASAPGAANQFTFQAATPGWVQRLEDLSTRLAQHKIGFVKSERLPDKYFLYFYAQVGGGALIPILMAVPNPKTLQVAVRSTISQSVAEQVALYIQRVLS